MPYIRFPVALKPWSSALTVAGAAPDFHGIPVHSCGIDLSL